ncbi:MAG TPA: hypothetical protein VFS21_33020 [Roseiflexaceae bacterium]|nr:hypothetical protein [Roseiflexaceae bacterium]
MVRIHARNNIYKLAAVVIAILISVTTPLFVGSVAANHPAPAAPLAGDDHNIPSPGAPIAGDDHNIPSPGAPIAGDDHNIPLNTKFG